MKRRLFFAAILVFAAFFVGRQVNRFKSADAQHSNRQETRQSYRLDPGARVEVRGINGSVEINTADVDAADVRVTYEGGEPEELEGRRIVVVEHDASSLVVRGEGGGNGFWRWVWGAGDVRVAVVLTVPRRVEITAKGINGPLEVGAVEGAVRVAGVNGRVEVAQAAGHVEVSGVNGNVKLGVPQPDAQGIEVKGVNGNVEVRLRANIDADLSVRGHNGLLSLNVPNVTMEEREGRSRLRARLGAGGAPITFRGVNGNVSFESEAGAPGHVSSAASSLPPPPPPPPAAPHAPRD
jgi:hypothetical protein